MQIEVCMLTVSVTSTARPTDDKLPLRLKGVRGPVHVTF